MMKTNIHVLSNDKFEVYSKIVFSMPLRKRCEGILIDFRFIGFHLKVYFLRKKEVTFSSSVEEWRKNM